MPQVTLPPDMPIQMEGLPRDEIGRPVPFFVAWVDGKPDFRLMDERAWREATMRDLCWVCGRRMKLTTRKVFVAGPMCLVNGTSAEPPMHYRCAEWCVRACPFLLNPNKVRREAHIPAEATDPGGIAIKRNPGVVAIIEAARYWIQAAENGYIIRFAQVRSVEWFREGRQATAAEVRESMRTGYPALRDMAASEGLEAQAELATMYELAKVWLPA